MLAISVVSEFILATLENCATLEMEEIIYRFPHLSEQIFANLNNLSLVNCNIASRCWFEYLKETKFLQIRIIEGTIIKQPYWNIYRKSFLLTVLSAWIELSKTVDTKTMIDLKTSIMRQYPLPPLTPLHFAAQCGDILLYEDIKKRTQDKTMIIESIPNTIDGCTPLCYAAGSGQYKVVKFILETSTKAQTIFMKKYPCKNGSTPYHLAAKGGWLKICELFVENNQDKNPKDNFGMTPLHYAARGGYLEICELILSNIEDKYPQNNIGETPLMLAAKHGHTFECKFQAAILLPRFQDMLKNLKEICLNQENPLQLWNCHKPLNNISLCALAVGLIALALNYFIIFLSSL